MSEMVIPVETLDGGLRAAFINRPHFTTSSVRLYFNAGSMHENPQTAGAGHFMEHIAHWGTEELPTEPEINDYRETNEFGDNWGAQIGKTRIGFYCDGYDLPVLTKYIDQVALHPLIQAEDLERDRHPVIDEIRGMTTGPYNQANQAHLEAIGGELLSKPVGGYVEDVQNLTHENLVAYYERFFRLGNATLIIASAEPVERQYELAAALSAGARSKALGGEAPLEIELPKFNPLNQPHSLELVDMPKDTQTTIQLHYGLPENLDPRSQFGYWSVAHALSKSVLRRLRFEKGLCYHAEADWQILPNLAFGANQNWAYIFTVANLGGDEALEGLKQMYDVANSHMPDEAIESVLQSHRRTTDHLLEGAPAVLANSMLSKLTTDQVNEYAIDENRRMADSMNADIIHDYHRQLTDNRPLVCVTTPSQDVYDAAGEWAESLS